MSSDAMDRPTEPQAPDPERVSDGKDWHFRPAWVLGSFVAVILLGVGLGIGIGRLTQDDGGTELSFVAGTTVVGNELTERQLEMVEVAEQYVDAWIEKNGDAVASFMAPDGFVELATLGNRTLRADDGTLQDWVENTGQIPNDLNDPIIVEDHRVLLVGQIANLDWMIGIEFTTSGDVMIVRDTHWVW